jgi:histidine triad (HIT) family protein
VSLVGAYDPENIFAKILRGDAPCVRVYEDAAALAFMDLFPQTRGHTLVVAKAPGVRNFLELPQAAIGPYLEAVQIVAKGVATALQPDGLRISQFNGAPAGQTVFHVHFHILPIYAGTGVAAHAATKADATELQALAAKISAAIG